MGSLRNRTQRASHRKKVQQPLISDDFFTEEPTLVEMENFDKSNEETLETPVEPKAKPVQKEKAARRESQKQLIYTDDLANESITNEKLANNSIDRSKLHDYQRSFNRWCSGFFQVTG